MDFLKDLLCLVLACAGPTPGADLTSYDGKSPFAKINGRTFFEQDQVARAITTMAGQDALDFIADLSLASSVELRHEALIVTLCRQDDCAGANAALALSVDGKLIALCLYAKDGEPGAQAGQVRWVGDKFDRTLPYDAARAGCPHEVSEFLHAYSRAIE